MIGAATVVLFVAVLAVSFVLKKYFERHPTHNPLLYVKKGLKALGGGIKRIFKRK